MKHPFLHIIEAIAEGKEVQFFNKSMGSCGVWRDLSSITSTASRTDLYEYLIKAAEEHLDWRIKPITVTGWINVYPDKFVSREIYPSKDDADNHSHPSRIACVEVTYTEGQGLDT